MIRLPDIPNLAPNAIDAPPASMRVAAAPAVALEGFALKLASTSNDLHTHAVRVQQLQNATKIAEARQQMATEIAKHQAGLASDMDPESRLNKTQEFLQTAKLRLVDNADLSPAARDQLNADFLEAGNRAYVAEMQAGVRLSTKRAAAAFANEIETAKQTGDRGLFTRSIETARESGIILPEDEVRLGRDFDRSLSDSALGLAIEQDPALVLEDIERPDFFERFPGLSPDDIPRIRRSASQSAERVRFEQIELLQEALLAGKLRPSDLEAADYLKASDRAEFRKTLERAAAPTPQPLTAEEHGKAWDRLLKLRAEFTDTEITDSDYAARFNDARAEILNVIANTPEAFRADITSELTRRAPGNRSASKLQPVGTDRAELKAIALDRITRARAAGIFGNTADDAPPAEREKAYRVAESLRLKASQWIEKNADTLDLPQLEEFTDSLISGDRVKNAARSLQSFVPGSGQSLRPAPSLPVVPALPPKDGHKDKAADDPLQIPPGTGETSDALLPARQKLDSLLSDQ